MLCISSPSLLDMALIYSCVHLTVNHCMCPAGGHGAGCGHTGELGGHAPAFMELKGLVWRHGLNKQMKQHICKHVWTVVLVVWAAKAEYHRLRT